MKFQADVSIVEPDLTRPLVASTNAGTATKPAWLKIRPPTQRFSEVKQVLRAYNITTVCEESHCPNMSECWSGGTATFMAMGDTCSRGCRFCQIKAATKIAPLDPYEPENMARAAQEMGLSYVVMTSVARDDLPDQGAQHLKKCVEEIKKRDILVEILIPDMQGKEDLIDIILSAKPQVLAHNIETVRRLTPMVRDRRASYDQTLKVLSYVKKKHAVYTKSSIMVGLGETPEEVLETMRDLRGAGVDILTIGQYLQPSKRHIKLQSYVHPNTFAFYEEEAKKMGFLFVASGPFVRSSYKAGELFMEQIIRGGDS
ncbi:lipoyl synthase [Candidatus Woesearchaeota archaeon]|nr:MAG: lipoyl synthase [Candidatus Woesearchaeota archaeon]